MMKRGEKIVSLDFAETAATPAATPPEPQPAPRGVESRTGLLKLRVVDED